MYFVLVSRLAFSFADVFPTSKWLYLLFSLSVSIISKDMSFSIPESLIEVNCCDSYTPDSTFSKSIKNVLSTVGGFSDLWKISSLVAFITEIVPTGLELLLSSFTTSDSFFQLLFLSFCFQLFLDEGLLHGVVLSEYYLLMSLENILMISTSCCLMESLD